MGGALLALVVWTQVAPPASEAAGKAQAQLLLREGSKLYRKGRYDEALERFTEAYALYPSPKLHFNVAQANRELDRPVEAMLAFERFLGEASGAPRSALAEARRSVVELRTRLGQVEVECATGDVEVRLDDATVGRTPMVRPLWATPGRHVVALRADGFAPFSEPVEVRVGETTLVTAVLRPLKLTPTPPVLARIEGPMLQARPADDPVSWSRLRGKWWFWGGVAAVALGAGIATAFALGGGVDVPATSLGTQTVFR